MLGTTRNSHVVLLFTGQYFLDFKAVNAGTFSFDPVIRYLGLGLTDCSKYCVQQLGNQCQGSVIDVVCC